MPVYVDRAKNPYGRMKMCHMMVDTIDELHKMADSIGIKRKWFQNKKYPHYDIYQSKKAAAISLGAIEVSNRELYEIMKKYR